MRKSIYKEGQWLLFALSSLIFLLSAALMVSNANAAIVETSYTKDYEDGAAHGPPLPQYHHTVSYRAAEGENNDLTISLDSDGQTRIIDPGALIQAGSNCQSLSQHEAVCNTNTPAKEQSGSNYVGASVSLGDGNDRASLGVAATADGGDGDDVIFGSKGSDFLIGGPGSDELYGGPGDDFLRGSDGATPTKDILDGGDGSDYVSYKDSQQPVSIDLRTQSVSGAGEGDVLRSIENAQGGEGNDNLVGSLGDNYLVGGDGDDNLSGNEGNDNLLGGNGLDTLNGENGNDTLDGGSGLDTLNGGDGIDKLYGGKESLDSFKQDRSIDIFDAGSGNDEVNLSTPGEVARCGDGFDNVPVPVKGSISGLDCEQVTFFEPLYGSQFNLPPKVVSGKKAVEIVIPCDYESRRHGRCPGKVVVSVRLSNSKSVKIASRRFSIRDGNHSVQVVVPSRLRKVLRPEIPLSIHVELSDFYDQDKHGVPKAIFDYTAFAQYLAS